MMDINLNFAGLFTGCFNKNKDKHENIENLRANILTMSKDMKLRYVLQKILNGTFDVLFLNSINGLEQKNMITLGVYDHLKPAFFRGSVIIPIFIEDHLRYSLVLCSYKSVIKTYNKGLVKILSEILTPLD